MWTKGHPKRLGRSKVAISITVGEPLTVAGREAWAEREHLDEEHARDGLALAAGQPPARAVAALRIEVRERVGGHQPVALEEGARLLDGGALIYTDLREQRGRGHVSSID